MTMARGNNLILDIFATCQKYQDFCSQFPILTNRGSFKPLEGSLTTILGVSLHNRLLNQVLVFVAPSSTKALDIEADLETLVGKDSFVSYPQREQLPQIAKEPDREITGMQIESLEAILKGRSRLLVTTLRALQERILIPETLDNLRTTLRVGSEFGFSELVRTPRRERIQEILTS